MVPFYCCSAPHEDSGHGGATQGDWQRCLGYSSLPAAPPSQCRIFLPAWLQGRKTRGPGLLPPSPPLRPSTYLPTCLQVSADYERVCVGCVNADSSSKTFVRQEGAVADHWSWVHWIWLAALSCCWPSTR